VQSPKGGSLSLDEQVETEQNDGASVRKLQSEDAKKIGG